jgi:SAM-dependent methyltransferase
MTHANRWHVVTAGTQGYAAQAEDLIRRYESVPFVDKHRAFLPLIQDRPGHILDVGAGTGADAAWLAERGHTVLAIEPTHALRASGMALHPSPRIAWLDDSLPCLASTRTMARVFDLVLMIAVWMHLDRHERETAMPNVASLVKPGGALLMTLRHGPVPSGRRMFDVTADETVELAQGHGLREILRLRAPSAQAENRRAGVQWTQLALLRTP